jgi:hypothetical protein
MDGMFLENHSYSIILECSHDLSAVVGGTVINDYEFEIIVGLFHNTVYR